MPAVSRASRRVLTRNAWLRVQKRLAGRGETGGSIRVPQVSERYPRRRTLRSEYREDERRVAPRPLSVCAMPSDKARRGALLRAIANLVRQQRQASRGATQRGQV